MRQIVSDAYWHRCRTTALGLARSDEPDRRDRASNPECDGLGLAAGPYGVVEELPHGRRHERGPRLPGAGSAAGPPPVTAGPESGGLILVSLIIVAAVANLNLSVANVALPSIGAAFDASQTSLDLVAVGYSLGLAASVLWLGAIGDRYGRKMLLLLGVGLSIPACLLAAFAPSIEVLIAARIVGGVSAGMAYPTTLALITALWAPGPGRTHSIALWSALGGAIAALGPLVSGFLLENFEWGSVFLVTLPLAVVALFMAWRFVPAHVNETTDPVDNLGGILSAHPGRNADPGDQLRARPEHDGAGDRPGGHLHRGDGRVRHPPATDQGSPVRPRHRRPADVLGRRRGRDHRLRIADGGDVHRPAIPPERPRILDARGRHGRSSLPRSPW